jgi:hypothetical protein
VSWKIIIGDSKKSVLLQEVYLQVLLTELAPVANTPLFLKPTDLNKNRLAAFHS